MTKNKTACLAALLAACLMGTGASAMDRPDSWITTKVKAALAGHRSVSAINTHVETDNGVVTLRGTAKSEAEKELAERYTRDIEGVREVRNEIKVSERSDRGNDRSYDRSNDRSEDRSNDRMDQSNDQRGIGDKALDKLDDATITSRVKSALAADRSTSAMRTDVDTRDGVVTLNGYVHSQAERDMAEKLASQVKGVKSVENRLEIR